MRNARFQIEFITPALLGGAEPHEWAELRAPSIRGQLRWWFRALGHSPDEEARIFGSVRADNGRASTVTIRVTDLTLPNGELPVVSRGTHKFQPAIDAAAVGGGNINSPEGYLAFNLRPPRRPAPYKRGLIPEKSRFVLRLSAARLAEGDFHLVCQIVRLFAAHGSLGTRSRRTFGCLRLVGEQGDLPTHTPALTAFPNRRIDWREVTGVQATNANGIRRSAGTWLREHRRALPPNQRNVVFGMAGDQQRLASPVILRPVQHNGLFRLGLVVPRPLSPIIEAAIRE
jgi:CRISPR type III-B/RAMP module RAMP protein Cmr1